MLFPNPVKHSLRSHFRVSIGFPLRGPQLVLDFEQCEQAHGMRDGNEQPPVP